MGKINSDCATFKVSKPEKEFATSHNLNKLDDN